MAKVTIKKAAVKSSGVLVLNQTPKGALSKLPFYTPGGPNMGMAPIATVNKVVGREYSEYGTMFTALDTASVVTKIIPIDANSDFIFAEFGCCVFSGATGNSLSNSPVVIQVSDSSSGYTFFNRPLPVTVLCSNLGNQRRSNLPIGFRFTRSSSITVTASLSGASTATFDVYVNFGGVKEYTN